MDGSDPLRSEWSLPSSLLVIVVGHPLEVFACVFAVSRQRLVGSLWYRQSAPLPQGCYH